MHRDTHAQTHTRAAAHPQTHSGKPRDRQTGAADKRTHTNRGACYADKRTPHSLGSVPPWFLATTRVTAPIIEAALSRPRRPAPSPDEKPFSSPLHPASPPAPWPAGAPTSPSPGSESRAVSVKPAIPGAPVPTASLLSAPGPEDPRKLRKLSEIGNTSSCPAQHPTPSPQALELQHSTQAGSSLTASFLGSNP